MAKKRPAKPMPEPTLEKAAADLVHFHERQAKLVPLKPAAAKRAQALRAKFDEALASHSEKKLAAAAGPEPVPIADFFSLVSAGLVDAQRNLDEQSRKYLRDSATQPHALPSIFRIPKVTAEMKLAVETTKEHGLGFIIYKDQTKAEQLNQQTVQFDIVATPPPPDFVAPPVAGGLVRLRSDREEIRSACGPLPAAVLDAFDRVLILEIVDRLEPPGLRRFLLAYADAESLGVWWLPPNAAPVPLLAFKAASAALASLREFLAAAGDHQQAFLAGLS